MKSQHPIRKAHVVQRVLEAQLRDRASSDSGDRDLDSLHSAMDTLGDSALVLLAAEARTFIDSDIGGNYLLLFGVYQAIELHVNAISHIAKFLEVQVPAESWQVIESLKHRRVLIAGHPFDRQANRNLRKAGNSGVSRITMIGQEFKVYDRPKNEKYQFEIVNFVDDALQAIEVANTILALVTVELRQRSSTALDEVKPGV